MADTKVELSEATEEKQVPNAGDHAETQVYGGGGVGRKTTLTSVDTEMNRFGLKTDKQVKMAENQVLKIDGFREDLFMRLYKSKSPSNEEICTFEELYAAVRAMGVDCNRTMIWNIFLTAGRRVKDKLFSGDYDGSDLPSIHAAAKLIDQPESEIFRPEDLKDEHGKACVNFLYNMKRSFDRHKTKVVPHFKARDLGELIRKKFLRGAGINMVLSTTITLLLICTLTQKEIFRFPKGENIFDARTMCYWCLGFFGTGSVFYMGSVMAFWWMPRSYFGLFVSTILMLKNLPFIILIAVYVASSSYLDNDNCYKCADCDLDSYDDREDKPCFARYSADTCDCALVPSLQEHINIPNLRRSQVCGDATDISECACSEIWADSTKSNPDGNAEQTNTCVYYEATLDGNYLTNAGWFLVIFITFDFVISFFRLLFWFMTYVGCGKGRMSGCKCCCLDFDQIQEELDVEQNKNEL